MFDAVWTVFLEPLKSRREVRSFLAGRLNDLTGGQAQQDLSTELSALATGSDREVIDSYRRLDTLCGGISARDAKYAGMVLSLKVRDLFAKALQRMKELPPDPRETLHAKVPRSAQVEQPGQVRTTGRGVSLPVASRELAARVLVKPARRAHSPRWKGNG